MHNARTTTPYDLFGTDDDNIITSVCRISLICLLDPCTSTVDYRKKCSSVFTVGMQAIHIVLVVFVSSALIGDSQNGDT